MIHSWGRALAFVVLGEKRESFERAVLLKKFTHVVLCVCVNVQCRPPPAMRCAV